MPVTDLMIEGIHLMLLGMGSVFLFLTLLVIGLKGMSRLAQALASEEMVATQSTGELSTPDQDTELLAVISAAIARYRSTHK